MLVSCPNCATTFSVPDAALGPKGRTLRCARCRGKWFQPAAPAAKEFGLDDLPPPPKPRPASRPEPDAEAPAVMAGGGAEAPPPEAVDPAAAAARAAARLTMAFSLDHKDDGSAAQPEGAGIPSGLDFGHEPIPDVFRQTGEPRKKGGTAGLWLLLILLLLCGLAGAAYYFQEKIVDLWPPADRIMTDLGVRREKPGSGLELRNAGTPERTVLNGVDVLTVRGIIANVSDRVRKIPPMKLTLLDKDKNVVQETIDQPPVAALDAGGTASFSIQVQRPDPNAVEVNVVFVDPAEAAGK
ncbi:MAG: zinc-ribbon domain-containing protein [Magnetospirillum sp.]|nr:zinc-ribbon domain-containing protein [Magnetospirillum sp.]